MPLAAMALLLAAPAGDDVRPSFKTAIDLQRACRGSQQEEEGCLNYIAGVTDAIRHLAVETSLWPVKIPDRFTIEQLRDVVVVFIDTHPPIQEQDAANIVFMAYALTFADMDASSTDHQAR